MYTQERLSRGNRSRDWSYKTGSQGRQRQFPARDAKTDSQVDPPEPSEFKTLTCQSYDLLQFLFIETTWVIALCYSHHGKLVQTLKTPVCPIISLRFSAFLSKCCFTVDYLITFFLLLKLDPLLLFLTYKFHKLRRIYDY